MKAILPRVLLLVLLLVRPACGESMLQYFNTTWAEITRKMPELAEAGYQSLWLPPPTKASGGMSVGYDVWDRFDLGSKDQRGTVRTRYGTEQELLEMVRVAHRFGIRVYFDNVMNHNAFDIPKYNSSTPVDLYPGFVPEDFHLRKTEDGFYRKWDNTRDWNDAWQVQNLGLSDLLDIATEPGGTNFNFGTSEGSTAQKPWFIRHPNDPEYYCYDATGNYVGFGTENGLTTAYLNAHPEAYSERVEEMLNRAARWQLDRTKADGFRLDAVKHTPADFFGATYGEGKDSSDYGYTGQAQRQFNITRGFSDTNHRDSVFNTEQGRDDAMMFGEHLGQPPPYGPYIDAGMRLVDNDLRSNLNNLLGNPSGSLNGYQNPGSGGFPYSVSVAHAQSHDSDYSNHRDLQHALYFTRAGMGLVYTDGNYHASVLGGSGGAFPRHANTAFLGQWGDSRIPNLLQIHQNFARGWQKGIYGSADLITYERIDKRENGGMSDAAGATMLVAVNDNYAAGLPLAGGTSFPSTGGAGSENNPNTGDEYLYQYARGDGSQLGFYKYASDLFSTMVPSGSYFIFAPRTPEPSNLWKNTGGPPIAIYQNSQRVGTVTVTRRDGSEGDPGFNPQGLPDAVTNDYSYQMDIPRVTSATDLRFVLRADGSAENVLLRLDGGVDLNGTRPGGDPFFRDNPPGVSTDVFNGYEQAAFLKRTGPEKFAATNTARNIVGSSGAETYRIGSTTVNGIGTNPQFTDTTSFVYHDPAAVAPDGGAQSDASGSGREFWVKTNTGLDGYKAYLYYTNDGSNPEGAGGEGSGTTKVIGLSYDTDFQSGSWFRGVLTPLPPGTVKYKISAVRENAGGSPLASVYPSGADSVARKLRMMTVFHIDHFNATTAVHAPHNDYGAAETGLSEGFHVLRARPFLKRPGKTSLYDTFTQTFYYDVLRARGQIVYPTENGDTVGGSEYGLVVRADQSTTEVWYKIDDGDATNNDSATTANNGNATWVRASEVTPNAAVVSSNPAYSREFRFNYVNIPASGTAAISVRLKEVSSSTDNSLADAAGHFTTITRTVNTSGPDLRLFVAYPTGDGDVIDHDYTLKVYFSKSLADGLSEAALKSRFLVRFGADDSWTGNGQTLDVSALSIVYNETADYHALAFKLPDLYDGRPAFLYRVEIRHERPIPSVDLTASRRVTFNGTDHDPQGDPDHDGVTNIIEWLLGMNPQVSDLSAYPKLQITRLNGGVRLTFPTISGRTYQLLRSDGLQSWEAFGNAHTTAPNDPAGFMQLDDTMGQVGRFYRMRVTSSP